MRLGGSGGRGGLQLGRALNVFGFGRIFYFAFDFRLVGIDGGIGVGGERVLIGIINGVFGRLGFGMGDIDENLAFLIGDLAGELGAGLGRMPYRQEGA